MRWDALDVFADFYGRLTRGKTTPEQLSQRLSHIRHTMLDMLGEDGAKQYPDVARRIRHGSDAQALWYARADLMAALAGLRGEQWARKRMRDLPLLFNGLLPKALITHPPKPRQ